MYLKQIEINGFKSFAKKTTLTFFPPEAEKHSITAIVGPNGSGKSNIADAIRWVLGEQRITQLRGKKSQDIIFSGSAARGQLGKASVVLVLDNIDRRIPLDFDEVTISRHIYRSGENQYRINGKLVRFLDFQILLAKAHFARASYGVIGQGVIDKILLQTPAERKLFFDEAVGIKEYQIKRRQAWLKLNRTHDHLEQAELIIQEIEPRVKSLARQAKKLEQRQEIKQQLEHDQYEYYAAKWNSYNVSITEFNEDIKELQEEYDNVSKALAKTQEELAVLAREGSQEDQFAALQNEHQKILSRQQAKERDRVMLQGKLQSASKGGEQQQLSWLITRIDELSKQKRELTQKLVQTKEQHEHVQDQLLEARRELSLSASRRDDLRAKLLLQSQGGTNSERQGAGYQSHQMRIARRLQEEVGGADTIFGFVSELAECDPQFAMALDVAAGKHLSSIVVKDEQVGRACVELLRRERLGVATFLPLSTIRAFEINHSGRSMLNHAGVDGFAQELIDFDHRFYNIFSFIFRDTLILNSANDAEAIGVGRIRMVTRDGDVYDRSGSIRGGYRSRRHGGFSFAKGSASLSMHGSDDALQKQLEIVEKRYDSLSSQVAQFTAQTSQKFQAIELLETQLSQVQTEVTSLEHDKAMQSGDPEAYSDAIKNLDQELKASEQELTTLAKEDQEVQSKITLFNRDQEKKRQRVFALQETMQDQQITINGFGDKLHEEQIELAKLQTKQEDTEREAQEELQKTIQSFVKEIEVSENLDIDELYDRIKKLKHKLQLIGGIDDSVLEEYEMLKVRYDDLSTQLKDLNDAQLNLEKLITELDDIMKKKRSKQFKQIQKEFARYFSILFNGGTAKLEEVYGYESEEAVAEDELEDTEEEITRPQKKILKGIEIIACPPGKKIKHVQSLSGGERTMAAIALICAVIKTNPAPFVVLDEVEAALDEANSLRFTHILKELAERSQCILITHNRASMHAADALYGVTMGGDGISKLLSVKLAEAV